MKVAVFAEDAAQLDFITALVLRIADGEGIEVTLDARNAVGGRGAVLRSLRSYVRDLALGRADFADVLVVALDSNCRGVNDTVASIREIAEKSEYAGLLVCAIPDPHVEIWYLADGGAVSRALGSQQAHRALPEHKCERGRYKQLLREEFNRHDIDPPGGGAEYGREVAEQMDMSAAGRSQPSFGAFVTDLAGAFRQLRQAG